MQEEARPTARVAVAADDRWCLAYLRSAVPGDERLLSAAPRLDFSVAPLEVW